MRSKRAYYEVRCLGCDVTFPVETRNCMHCGERTVASSEVVPSSRGAVPVFDFDTHVDPGSDASRWSAEPEGSGASDAHTGPQPIDVGEVDSSAPSVGRSILGSMGSLIWVVLLIALSLTGRVCGGE